MDSKDFFNPKLSGKRFDDHTIPLELLEDFTNVPSRLEEFLNLESGWLDGVGVQYSKTDLDWLIGRFEAAYNREILLPFTFPTIDGGVQFEWKRNEHDLTLEIDLTAKAGYIHYLNTSTDESSEQNIDLNNDNNWDDLNTLLLQYFKK